MKEKNFNFLGMRAIICFFIYFINLTSFAQSFYHDYYTNMINILRITLMDRDTLWLDEIPMSIYKSDTLSVGLSNLTLDQERIEKCISGKSDDARFFYEFSALLVDSLFYNRKVCTKNEIDSIESWWKRNEKVITPDFLRDIMWTIRTAYNTTEGWEFFLRKNDKMMYCRESLIE
ncbi:MAG: hypothetical protein HDR90_07965 [Bacteroides sp.]|nr:hypothetical protein [Bacteroides sp.]